MSTPVCSVHGKPMRPGKKGGWYCPTKMSDGSWCDQRISAPRQAPAPMSQPSPPLNDEAIKLRVWEGVSRLFQGSGMPEDALDHARSVYQWVKEGQ